MIDGRCKHVCRVQRHGATFESAALQCSSTAGALSKRSGGSWRQCSSASRSAADFIPLAPHSTTSAR